MKQRGIILTAAAVALIGVALVAAGVSSQRSTKLAPVAVIASVDSTGAVPASAAVDSSAALLHEATAATQTAAGESTSTSKTAPKSKTRKAADRAASKKSTKTKQNPPAVTSALDLAKRQACYYDLVAAEDRSVSEAEAAYPSDADPPNIAANNTLRFALYAKYEALVCSKFGISVAQAAAISDEGASNGWPMPPLPE